MPDDIPELQLSPWLRRVHPGAPVELVTRAGVVAEISVVDWLRLVEDGTALFGPDLRRAVEAIADRAAPPG